VRAAPLLLLLAGCAVDGSSPFVPPQWDEGTVLVPCDGTDAAPQVVLCPREEDDALVPGAVVDVYREYQGAIVMAGDVRFDGLPGGTRLPNFVATVTADGEELARRQMAHIVGECGDDGVFQRRLEIFFERVLDGSVYDGLEADLTLSVDDPDGQTRTWTIPITTRWVPDED
jgi:hypothetical protein